MKYQIGTQLRTFRLKCSMTQEQLAEKLNVTSQTISKWENGISCPDIMILPELTAILGMTLDELFQSSPETHLKRIEHMLEHELSSNDFEYAQRELKNAILNPNTKSQGLTLLAELYVQKSHTYMKMARDISLQALELDPAKKDNHSLLNISSNAHVWDWCATHHSDYIDFYKQFVKNHPDYPMGYEWLICNLLEDNRLQEAEEVLQKMIPYQDECHLLLYKGWILRKGGKIEEAETCWNKMLQQEDWLPYSFRGDVHASLAEYDKAIDCYKRAAELEPSPKYTDNWLSIAQIYKIQGNYSEAINAYQHVLHILKEDYQLIEGRVVDDIKQEISNLAKS